jgi:hypothetical protein
VLFADPATQKIIRRDQTALRVDRFCREERYLAAVATS